MIKAENRIEDGLFMRMVTDDGKYEVAVHPVMFGYRIRAGEVDSMMCQIDYCCVKDLTLLTLTYACVASIMNDRSKRGMPVFKELPRPLDKYYREPECLNELVKLAADITDLVPAPSITAENLQKCREKFLSFCGFPGTLNL